MRRPVRGVWELGKRLFAPLSTFLSHAEVNSNIINLAKSYLTKLDDELKMGKLIVLVSNLTHLCN